MARHVRMLLAFALLLAASGCESPQRPSVRFPVAVAGEPAAEEQPRGQVGPQALPRAAAAAPEPRRGNVVGRVRLPASIVGNNSGSFISENGGAILGNNGGGIIGNNGGAVVAAPAGRFALAAAPAQVPFAGARVRLLDAAGRPVKVASHVVEAIADREGRYALDAPPGSGNLLLEVALPARLGALRAIVPARTAPETTVDIDFVSTLATAGVLDLAAGPSEDPQLALDRLSAALEAETRAAVARAVERGALDGLADLAPATIDRLIAELRAQDAAFEAQLAKVRAALRPADAPID